MNLRVDPVDIASGSLRTVSPAFKDIDPVSTVRNVGAVQRQAKLYGHVEARDSLRQLNAREIVNRKVRLLDESDDGFEPALVWDREGCIYAQTKLGEADQVSQIQILERLIVRDVEEYRFYALAPCHTKPIAYPLPEILFAPGATFAGMRS